MRTLLWTLMAWLATVAISSGLAAGELARPPLEHRWIYLATNLLVDKNVGEGISLLQRAVKVGYNGVVLTDSKFLRWDQLPERYLTNVRRVRQACRDLKLACIACVCPSGYSNDLLSRDPNLAEGLPVRDAPFVVHDGKLIPDDDVRIVNGGFEQSKKNAPAGWSFVDQPGKISFIDGDVKSEGRSSLRMEDIGLHDPQHGNGRACQKIATWKDLPPVWKSKGERGHESHRTFAAYVPCRKCRGLHRDFTFFRGNGWMSAPQFV